MADSQHTERPAAVTPAKRDSYLRYVQIHLELLHDSLAGQDFGCGLGQWDREEIDRHLLEIWNIASAANLTVVEPATARADDVNPPPSMPTGKVIPFRPRLAG